MCQPASPGSLVLGNRTGIVPPTPWRGIQRPRPRSWSYTSQSAGDVPAAANAGPSGQAKRTTGFVHVTRLRGSMPRARSSSSISATHVRTTPGATARRTATNPSARNWSIAVVMAHHATQTGSRQSFRSYPRSEAARSPGAESRELEEEGSHGNSQGGETRRVAQGTEETPSEGEGVHPDA